MRLHQLSPEGFAEGHGAHTPPRSAIRPRKELASDWGPSIPPSKLPRPTTTPSSTSTASELSSIFP
ncbi:hypothetical protein LINGRAHAP2_LOCUS23861 [Linum grandiflorum]